MSRFLYVTLGEARIADVSADDGAAQEHQLTLHAWSRQGGRKEAHVITGALLQALDDAPLTPDGHRLVNLRFWPSPTCGARADGRTYHAVVRFRADHRTRRTKGATRWPPRRARIC